MYALTQQNHRILIIDDNQAIHADFKKILCRDDEAETSLDTLGTQLFQDDCQQSHANGFEIASAYQGQEGLAAVKAATEAGRPFALAFVDVRMPPGWDGVETIRRLWQVDPDLQIVICTAYSDRSWEEITASLGASDRFVILKKPFDVVEVIQLAHSLTRKWSLAHESKDHLEELTQKIEELTRELRRSEAR
jgi:two-component system NtrC family sensor kinase